MHRWLIQQPSEHLWPLLYEHAVSALLEAQEELGEYRAYWV